jgi:hypothetical protein
MYQLGLYERYMYVLRLMYLWTQSSKQEEREEQNDYFLMSVANSKQLRRTLFHTPEYIIYYTILYYTFCML